MSEPQEITTSGPVGPPEPTVVHLGNTAPIEPQPGASIDGEGVERTALVLDNGREDNNTITTLSVPAGMRLSEALVSVSNAYRTHHSDDPPEWVVSSEPLLARLLAEEFTSEGHECIVGRPDSWTDEDVRQGGSDEG